MTTASELTRALGGTWRGSYGIARCPAHNDSNPSLSVRDVNGRTLVHCHRGCDQRDVIDALRARGLWGDVAARIGAAVDSLPTRDSEDRKRTVAALAIWRTARREDNAVGTYLRTRGITIPVPPSLRYHGALLYSPTHTHLPGMVAAVQNAEGAIVAVHRTYLRQDLTGKAGVLSPKMALGPLGDGAVRLAPAGSVLGLAEGIETGLSAMQLFGVPCWAVCGSRLRAVTLPQTVREVHLFADNGDAGGTAAERAADRLTKEGRRVLLRFPPEMVSDWNDVLGLAT